jgi:Flp pilus assembly pilin Flp
VPLSNKKLATDSLISKPYVGVEASFDTWFVEGLWVLLTASDKERTEKGNSIVEYAILIAFLALLTLAATKSMGVGITTKLTNFSNTIN